MNRTQLEGFNIVAYWDDEEWKLRCRRCDWTLELGMPPDLWQLVQWAELHSMDRRHTGE
jgi:hypothetical protein